MGFFEDFFGWIVDMFSKKTTWAGVAAIGAGASKIKAGDIPGGIADVATGAGLIFLRDGVRKLELPKG